MTVVVAREGEVIGEFSQAEFDAKISTGEILATDHYWMEGMSEWELVSAFARPSTMARTVKLTADELAPKTETPPSPQKSGLAGMLKRFFPR